MPGLLAPYLEQKNDYLLARQEAARFDPSPWQDIIGFRPPGEVLGALPKAWMVQEIALAEGPLSVDYYAVRVDKAPTVGGRLLEPAQLLEHIRRNLNDFVQTGYAEFEPYDERHGALWASPNPLGAVLHIDMAGPDNGSVLVSRSSAHGWIFSTVWTDRDGFHPVSGNREFGWRQERGTTIVYTRGADRTTGAMESAAPGVAFFVAGSLWQSLQSKIAAFVTANGGYAEAASPIQQTLEWREASQLAR